MYPNVNTNKCSVPIKKPSDIHQQIPVRHPDAHQLACTVNEDDGLVEIKQGKYVTTLAVPPGRISWRDSTVESILTNERYKGDALLQKQFTVDFLNKKMKNNEGEVPQYYVTDSHPAIIDRTEWELVQAEMARRKEKGNHQNSLNVFSSKIYCGECGSYYGSKLWHSTDKYRKVVWRCNGKYERQTRCSTKHLTNDEIKNCSSEQYQSSTMSGRRS